MSSSASSAATDVPIPLIPNVGAEKPTAGEEVKARGRTHATPFGAMAYATDPLHNYEFTALGSPVYRAEADPKGIGYHYCTAAIATESNAVIGLYFVLSNIPNRVAGVKMVPSVVATASGEITFWASQEHTQSIIDGLVHVLRPYKFPISAHLSLITAAEKSTVKILSRSWELAAIAVALGPLPAFISGSVGDGFILTDVEKKLEYSTAHDMPLFVLGEQLQSSSGVFNGHTSFNKAGRMVRIQGPTAKRLVSLSGLDQLMLYQILMTARVREEQSSKMKVELGTKSTEVNRRTKEEVVAAYKKHLGERLAGLTSKHVHVAAEIPRMRALATSIDYTNAASADNFLKVMSQPQTPQPNYDQVYTQNADALKKNLGKMGTGEPAANNIISLINNYLGSVKSPMVEGKKAKLSAVPSAATMDLDFLDMLQTPSSVTAAATTRRERS